MIVEVGLILVRFTHYASLVLLFGASLFPLYVYSTDRPAPFFEACWLSSVLLATSLVGLGSGVAWLALTAATLTDSLSSAINPKMLMLVLRQTEFGEIWALRLALGVMLSAALMVGVGTPMVDRREFQIGQATAGGVLLGSLAFVGHAQIQAGPAGAIHTVADVAHLLAAGAWLGGLAPLRLALELLDHVDGANEMEIRNAARLLQRFSAMTYGALAVVIGSGLVDGWFLVGSLEGLVGTEYGHWLMLKIALFVALLGAVTARRLGLTPDGASPRWMKQVRRQVVHEQAGGLVILLVVGVLGVLTPAVA